MTTPVDATPYYIHVRKRPQRVAFFIHDDPECLGIVDSILAHNRERWGGRYNPIVVTDGETLTTTWWDLLEANDPDIIRSFVPLGDDLFVDLQRRIAPYLIEQPRRGEDGEVHLHHEGLTIFPTSKNVRHASWAKVREPILVLFTTDRKATDPNLKRFVEWNFGSYSLTTQPVIDALEDGRVETHAITDASTLSAALANLTQYRPFTYPIQLCSIPNDALPPVEPGRFDEAFTVVIGDSPRDIAHWWNRPATLPEWSRTYLNQLWLPLALATDERLYDALSGWFEHAADPGGNHRGTVQFVSLSLTEERLREIVEPLSRRIRRVFRHVEILNDVEPPKISEGPPGQRRLDRMDAHRAAGRSERITLQEPDILSQGTTWGAEWMADLHIDFEPPQDPSVWGRPLYWQMPRIDELPMRMFQRQARVLRTRYPSILMTRGEPRVTVNLFDDVTVFRVLAMMPATRMQAEQGTPIPARRAPYRYARTSEKGRYLSGVLDLFGGLHAASGILREGYWRRMFDLLSGRNPAKEGEHVENVRNTLIKKIRRNSSQFYADDKAIEWLTALVIRVARQLPSTVREREWRDFEEHAKREWNEFNVAHPREPAFEYSPDDLKRRLADLTDRGVLLIGVAAKCTSCGYRDWHHIDDAKQTLRCRGCNTTFGLPPEQPWRYRLNSLARAAHADHGLVPVILVLAQLAMDARTGFIFTPCLDLFDDEDAGPVGDLDIAAIVDGELVIGEIKQSAALFDEKVFRVTEAVARRLLPDRVLFSSMDPPTPFVGRQIKSLSEALAPLGVAVRWYQLNDAIFTPWPVR